MNKSDFDNQKVKEEEEGNLAWWQIHGASIKDGEKLPSEGNSEGEAEETVQKPIKLRNSSLGFALKLPKHGRQ